ncbi:P-loop containing nucleoside triphosphate hydrolase protein [Irpex lacteus]|nr:P-loop containing nucleoside triphosphate hydrolase protein [Irpex lacteus]
MAIHKRKRTQAEDSDIGDSSGSDLESNVDISSALTGKKSKKSRRSANGTQDTGDAADDDDEHLQELIKESISKRNVKVERSKAKIVKGEVGGGSFQSMGLYPWLLRSLTLQGFRVPPHPEAFRTRLALGSSARSRGMARTGSGKSLAYLFLLYNDSALRWGLVVGGEGLDEQFEMISNNPDVIIATPGRLLHLISVQYVVFDEADRLFEMGFETALTESSIDFPRHVKPSSSPQPPKSLVEFAKAGLENPKLVRLDADGKISTDLRMAFFSVKQAEKDACLLYFSATGKAKQTQVPEQVTAPHQTLIFAATKHHVEYLTNMLSTAGYAVSHIYGALDQTARPHECSVVTDVAARVNYDFPHGARVFVHRVGRTARAGRQGWAWSFVTNTELPYLLDLQLFLGRPIKSEIPHAGDQVYTESLVLGPFDRDRLDEEAEYVRKLDEENHNLDTLREVMKKGKASQASYNRAKVMIKEGNKWGLVEDIEKKLQEEKRRKELLKAVSLFKPSEIVIEIGARGNAETAALMKQRRQALSKAAQRIQIASTSKALQAKQVMQEEEVEMADEAEIAAVFESGNSTCKVGKGSHRDNEYYMSYSQKDAHTEKGRGVTFDLAGDEALQQVKRRELRWDKAKKKFIRGGGEGADNVKLVKTESGIKLPASYREEPQGIPRVGEEEIAGSRAVGGGSKGGRKWKHNKLRKDYDRKSRQIKKKADSDPAPPATGANKAARNELKTVDQIRKSRQVAERRKMQNARPSKRGRR